MDRIATAAGVSKPTLYTYFQHKEGLFVALIQHMMESNIQIISRLHDGSDLDTPPDRVLRQIATSMLDKFSGNRSLLSLMRLLISESDRFPALAQTFIREIKQPLLEKLAGYLGSHPQLDLADPMVSARIFTGSLVHFLIEQEVMHGRDLLPMARDRFVDGLVRAVVNS